MIYKIYKWLEKKDNDLASVLASVLAFVLAFELINISELINLTGLNICILIITIIILAEILFRFNDKVRNPSFKRTFWLKIDALF